MIRHVWSVVCSKGFIDKESNAVSLLEALEELRIELTGPVHLPLIAPIPAAFISLWTRRDLNSPVRGEQRLRFLGPNGEELGAFLGEIDLETAKRSRTLIRFNGLRISGSGRYEWEVAFRELTQDAWTVVGSVPIDIQVDETSSSDQDSAGA